jgi:pimeloyl-ACP methyl ester carboxylesterase
VSTKDAARDMDVLRGALGEKKLNYLGKSYGTYLGTTYAGLFPKQVGRMVLDGVVAPDLTPAELNLGQAEGFERATRAWAAFCVETRKCPLGDSVDAVMQGLRTFLASVDQSPLPRTGDNAVPRLTEGWASLGIAEAMYSQGAWQFLVDAMRDAVGGDGTSLMQLADQYAHRDPGGQYSDNLMEVIYAVNCLDKADTSDIAERRLLAQESLTVAPTWGPFLMWSSQPCGVWPVKATGAPKKISATGADPIVVIGTTRDPATPYEWAVRLHDQLDKAALISFDGDGHTAYTRSNSCVDDAVNAYYLKGTLPKDGLRC